MQGDVDGDGKVDERDKALAASGYDDATAKVAPGLYVYGGSYEPRPAWAAARVGLGLGRDSDHDSIMIIATPATRALTVTGTRLCCFA